MYPYPLNRGDKLRWSALLAELAPLLSLRAVFGFLSSRDRRDPALERGFHSVQIVPISMWQVAMRAAQLRISGRPPEFGRLATPAWRRRLLAQIAPGVPVLLLGPNASVFDVPAGAVLDLTDTRSRVRTVTGNRVRPAILSIELALAQRFRIVLASDDDKTWLVENGADPGHITVIPNGVDQRFFAARSPGRSNELVFVGNFRFPPNRDGARWFLTECWPKIRQRAPAVRLRIVGFGARDVARSLSPEIEIASDVPDVVPYLETAGVAIAPLQSASGTQNKVLEAMAAGLPVVATSPVARGLAPNHPVLVRDDADTFAAACISVVNDEAARAELGAEGRAYVARHHSWAAGAGALRDLLVSPDPV
jgi:glycosyltransferase involved in cell wall biosynthesis